MIRPITKEFGVVSRGIGTKKVIADGVVAVLRLEAESMSSSV